MGFIDNIPYVFFLETALKENSKLYRVEHNEDINLPNKFVGEAPDVYAYI